MGPDDGRYLVRDAGGAAEHVLVVGGLTGLAVGFRRGRRRRERPRTAERDGGAPEVPVTRLTVIRPAGFGDSGDAGRWLAETAASEDDREQLIDEALAVVNRALHSHGLATADPGQGQLSAGAPLVTRIGFGTGDELADGRWSEAVEVPAGTRRLRRAEALRPQERLAAALGGRERQDACETLLLRARGDIDAGRTREAVLQLRVGLEALLVEVADEGDADQVADLAAIRERRGATGDAANEALAGELAEVRAGEVAETLRLCERVLRRRRVMAD